jgi:N-acetylmuramoyl-L-alanine amidase
VIDPGHGGIDPGAIGIGGLREVDVLWPVSMEVTRLLEQQGIRVVLTRTDNRTVELQPRVQIAQRANADVFVSIHANAISMSRPDVNGTETFYASPEGRRLAQAIQSSMIQATGMRDRGVKSARFYVIRNTTMPAVLVELGFVTGAEDAPRLSDPAFRSRMAQAIVRGILQYVRQR